MRRFALGLFAFVLYAAAAHAVEPDEILRDETLENRARALSAGLRCLVCQNQSIDDSQAPLARDLRILIRDRLKAGDTDDEVRKFVVARYGDFVLLKPPFEGRTLVLWLAPFLVLAVGAMGIIGRGRKNPDDERPMSGEERERLKALVDEKEQ